MKVLMEWSLHPDVGPRHCILQVLMKWSLHPEVGPRLRSGEPLLKPEEFPPDMQVTLISSTFLGRSRNKSRRADDLGGWERRKLEEEDLLT